MAKIITIANPKGGVAKTTTCIYIATLLSRNGKVLLKDTDPQASATEWLEDIENLPFDWEVANIRNMEKTFDYDFVVIDTPPQNSDIITKAIQIADFVIVPTSPSGLDHQRVYPVVDVVSRLGISYRVLLTQADSRTNSFKTMIEMFDGAGIRYFLNSIPKKEVIKKTFGKIPTLADEIKDYELFFNEFWSLLNGQ